VVAGIGMLKIEFLTASWQKILTHLLRWWIAVAEIIIYAKSVDNLYIIANDKVK
jgi:hypothetical protein